jgi:hypothetical protein
MEGKMKLKVGRFNCHADFKIVGLTNQTKEDFNRLLAKEECKNVEKC